ncbi:MAG: LytTR family transcriptional regulator [Bacteroidetes bacterium]|nr:LytTR family transcriptional regulator [Bacteroidota bacterium]
MITQSTNNKTYPVRTKISKISKETEKKPNNQNRLSRLEKMRTFGENRSGKFIIHKKNRIVVFTAADILFASANGPYTIITTKVFGEEKFSISMNTLTSALPDSGFHKISRSLIVNLNEVIAVEKKDLHSTKRVASIYFTGGHYLQISNPKRLKELVTGLEKIAQTLTQLLPVQKL